MNQNASPPPDEAGVTTHAGNHHRQETEPTPSAAWVCPTRRRLMSLDALRGFDMFWIVGAAAIVRALHGLSDARSIKGLASQLEHVPWAGFHFEDLIFPMFVFIVGVSIVFSLQRIIEEKGRIAATWRILRRAALLYLLGVFYYGGFGTSFEQIRLLGVLQRIALCYLFAGLIFVYGRQRGRILWCVGLLVGYWLVMTFVPVAMLFAYSQFQNIFLPKYLVYVLPVFLITAAHGFSSIRSKYVQVFIGVMVVAILGGSLFSYYQGKRNPDWKNALNRVLLEYREGDVVAFNSGENRVVWEYYQRRLAEDKEVEVYYFGDYSAVDADVSKHIREISQEYKQLMALYRRIWLVSSLVWVSDPQNLVEQIAEAAFLREGAWPGNPKVALYQMSD